LKPLAAPSEEVTSNYAMDVLFLDDIGRRANLKVVSS
jgi:hypothetical protein